METRRAILTCRTTSEFAPGGGTIRKRALDDLLRAAMSAPCAGSESPRHFVVLRETSKLADLAELIWEDTSLCSACIAIVVCADNRSERQMGQWVVDCAAASENVVIMTRDMDLGSAWVRVFPYKSRMNAAAKYLKLPHFVTPFSVIFIGRTRRPLRKLGTAADETRIHIGSW